VRRAAAADEPHEEERDAPRPWVLRLGDFGSAVDPHSVKHLYGHLGPVDGQQTESYAAPEVTMQTCRGPPVATPYK
jgi:hypothetical protein